ncbi:MAG: HD domain-containing protein [Planctomycetota bacterium]|jgi:hypothetical protein
MEQKQLEKFRSWFADFAAGFYGDDEYVNANIKLKEEHSLRTCDETRYLAEELRLDAGQRRIAEVIALLHDVGRFPQFIKYRTYNDPRSVNHCLLSLEVLREGNVLDGTAERERQLIEQAIEYHGLKELPSGLDEECLLFSKLIRDADKLDILYLVTGYYAQYRDEPESFKLEMELPNESGYSAAIVEAVLNGQRINYDKLETWNDMKLLQLSWVYDVNFAATLKRMRQRRLLEKVLDFLPDTEDIERVAKKISEYVDSRIEQEG